VGNADPVTSEVVSSVIATAVPSGSLESTGDPNLDKGLVAGFRRVLRGVRMGGRL
jgi:hypothetical protein